GIAPESGSQRQNIQSLPTASKFCSSDL
ncbi:hypothetical protein A2U01_0105706, partial [Trifolium medium]|nr:hypothetical protein [Trifolium medium]